VAYHETFWMVAGAAAPVIALAAVIQLRDISSSLADVKERLAVYQAAHGITRAELMQGTARERYRRTKKYGQPGFLPLFVLLGSLNLAVQSTVLAVSLQSLRQHADANLTFAASYLQFGIYCLAFISLGLVFNRGRWSRKLDRADSEKTDRDDSGEPSSPRGDTSPRAE
jgi:hypothetical protein